MNRIMMQSLPESQLNEYMSVWQAHLEKLLASPLPESWAMPAALRESMIYSLTAGGKRLRPILAIAAAEAAGGDPDSAVPAALAVEMIHTYSLIHDDLPAMDDDDLRRGKPTNHKVFGEAMAILAGDGLLTHAFHVLASSYTHIPQQALAMVEELARYAGASGMVGGQAADIIAEQGETTLDELEYIHMHKTSDLIVCSLRLGARSAGATEEQLQALTRFGANLGLAFQIQDDVLDLIGDEKKLGKPIRSDVKQEKVTYPYLLGIDACRTRIASLTAEAQAALHSGALPKPGRLLQLAEYLMSRDR